MINFVKNYIETNKYCEILLYLVSGNTLKFDKRTDKIEFEDSYIKIIKNEKINLINLSNIERIVI